MSGVNMQRFAKSSHLWPLSVFKHSPDELGFQIFTAPSPLQLASSPSMDQSMPKTEPLPFSQMSVNCSTPLPR
jgi:hypothetical protein